MGPPVCVALTHGWVACLPLLPATITGLGLLATVAGAIAVHRFSRRPAVSPRQRPPITVLRPLCGDEPQLEAALHSICSQAYPAFQIVFGVQDPHDPAMEAVQRVRRHYPGLDISVVADPATHGANRKISNLINMLPMAQHDVLVFSDSDLHVAPDYLDTIVAALEIPATGLVTTICTAFPTTPGPVGRLGATAISHSFLPGALLAFWLGRQDCLGTTMALRRETLASVGGLECLAGHLADDSVLADRVNDLGLSVRLASSVPRTAVPEAALQTLWQHELRWARTIRSIEPALFFASSLQFPLFWALLTWLISGCAAWAGAIVVLSWFIRAAAGWMNDQQLLHDLPKTGSCPVWLLAARDVMSVALVAMSFLGGRVVWRGHEMWADDNRPALVTLGGD